jgi:tetrahydromethanopterin S-methyltransferase subunit G
MEEALIGLIEPVVVFGTLFGIAFGVKFLVWGKGPIKRTRPPADVPQLDQRLTDIEERLEQTAGVLGQLTDQLADVDERMEFTERMLARRRMDTPSALEPPARGRETGGS